MSDLNSVILTGRLTRAVDTRITSSGVSVADLGLAVNRYGSGGKKFTSFIKVTAWNQNADFAKEHLNVGDLISVHYEKDGEQTSGRMKVDNVQIQLLRKKSSETTAATEETAEVAPA
jgi:single-strand DNA-binding protein